MEKTMHQEEPGARPVARRSLIQRDREECPTHHSFIERYKQLVEEMGLCGGTARLRATVRSRVVVFENGTCLFIL